MSFFGNYDTDKNGVFSVNEMVLNICDFLYLKLWSLKIEIYRNSNISCHGNLFGDSARTRLF